MLFRLRSSTTAVRNLPRSSFFVKEHDVDDDKKKYLDLWKGPQKSLTVVTTMMMEEMRRKWRGNIEKNPMVFDPQLMEIFLLYT